MKTPSKTLAPLKKELNDFELIWFISFIVLFAIIVYLMVQVGKLDNQLQDVPHKVCHNETKSWSDDEYPQFTLYGSNISKVCDLLNQSKCVYITTFEKEVCTYE